MSAELIVLTEMIAEPVRHGVISLQHGVEIETYFQTHPNQKFEELPPEMQHLWNLVNNFHAIAEGQQPIKTLLH